MIEYQTKRWLSAVVLMIGVTLGGCGRDENLAHEVPPAVVEAITVQVQPLALSRSLPGRIEPVRVAEVRARVAGVVLTRHFEEGADVEADDVLFSIDPAPFEADLSHAQGDLAKAEAALFEAETLLKRYEQLLKKEMVSRQDFDTAQAALRSAQAERQSARAGVESAQLNLDYATVRAPISGRIGRALVTEGALVGQGEATPLATIQQLDPVYVDFRQPVAEVVRLRTALAEGRLEQYGEEGALISITIEGSGRQREGHLLFSDITVDRSTGQVALRGQFENSDGLLFPGMFVRVHISQGIDPHAILVPQRAVQRGSDGKAQVMVVGPDDMVEVRQVETGPTHGTDWHIVAGLEAGERVIIRGNAQPGAKVTVTSSAPAQPEPLSTPDVGESD